MEHRDAQFIGLETVCRSLGIPRPKEVVDGSMVPQLVREGRAAEVCTYCAVDVAATAEAFRLMTSN
jgi:predicted PolB exonuclease-like 3'-5' exonuclease